MADFPSFESRVYPPYLPEDRQAIAAFLQGQGLQCDEHLDFTVAFLARNRMVATGSLSGRIIKCLAVDGTFQGEGLAASLVSRLEAEAAIRGIANPFVFTSPGNLELFSAMGYHALGEVPGAVVLLEQGQGLERWERSLRSLAEANRRTGPVATLVMNCNPPTLGHLHLIRTAAEASAQVFLFVVAEDASAFPTEVRLRLVREEALAFPNVTVVPGSEYLVSRATFPSYFLKGCPCDLAEVHARLDAGIFARRIAPALGAVRRYLGEEPFCPVTAIYNRVLKEELPRHGIEVVEIPRLAQEGEALSASRVRRHLREGNREAALRLVSPTTGAYLESAEAASVLQKLTAGNGRH
jgi:[citrate (pro-3S)-lyase] ligase